MKKEYTITGKVDANGLHISHDMGGKMEFVNSLSTSPLMNEFCLKRRVCSGSVCEKCFSFAGQYKKGLRNNLIENTEILTGHIFQENEILFLTSESGLFRFESFGDLNDGDGGEIQVANYFKHAEKNPHLHFALWTKNPWIIERAIKKYGLVKPENLRIIGSSYYLNKPMVKFYRRYWFIDNIFTVYTLDYVKANNVRINCGGLKCFLCRKCYDGTHDGYEINELLKQDAPKAKKAGLETFAE